MERWYKMEPKIFNGCSYTGKEIMQWCYETLERAGRGYHYHFGELDQDAAIVEFQHAKMATTILGAYYFGAKFPIKEDIYYNCRIRDGKVTVFRDDVKSPRRFTEKICEFCQPRILCTSCGNIMRPKKAIISPE
jgi:hypothetical protein